MMEYEIQKDGKFNYLEVGEGETLMLLHGLFGALSNFSGLIEKFRHTHKVVVPIMPLFDIKKVPSEKRDFSIRAKNETN